jgi:ADP-ribose pyrophosphatase YjhB (NUDIX family)
MSDPETDYAPLIHTLESFLTDPHRGLPEEVFRFVTRLTPMINVDLLIRDVEGRFLLTWRDDGFEYSPGWHLPGGIIRYKEGRGERIQAVAQNELGTSVRFQEEPLAVREVIHPTRRTRGHFISLLYLCELAAPPAEALRFRGGTPGAGQWAWHRDAPPDLIPVHDMYRAFLHREGSVPEPRAGARLPLNPPRAE